MAFSGWSWLIRNFSLDQFRQKRQRLLPAQIASFEWDGGRYPFLGDVQLGSAEHLLQDERRLHFAGQVRVIEFIRVADMLVGRQFEIGSAERVALAGGEISERHSVSATHLGVEVVNLARKSVGGKQLGHGVRIA